MELDWLETFLAVVDRGGFTAASEQVHRSQSRVSAHIAGLERELGVTLIDRTRRPATVTPAGDLLARHAREILDRVGSTRAAVEALRALSGNELSVLSIACAAVTLLPDVLAAVAERHPGLRVTLTERSQQEAVRGLRQEGVAAAVLPTLTHPLPPDLHEQLLWREPIQLLVPDGHELFLLGKPVPTDELARYPMIVCTASGEPELRERYDGLGQGTGHRVDTPAALVALTRAGLGVGVAGAVALEQLDTSGLARLDIDDPELVREVAAYWYDVLADSAIGADLLCALRAAPTPAGAIAPGGSAPRPPRR